MEGFFRLDWAAFWWFIALPCLAVGVYQLKKVLKADREALPLLGVTGGFVFILSSLKLPSVTGSCSHPTGTGLPAICFGPWITSVIAAIVLLFQALFLAHGGLSTLGANIVSMGIAGPLAGWGIYRLLRDTPINLYITVFLSVAITDLVTYVITSLQLALASIQLILPTTVPVSMAEVVTYFLVYLGIFVITQVPIAILEAIILVLVFKYIVQLRPGILIRLKIFPEEKIMTARSDA